MRLSVRFGLLLGVMAGWTIALPAGRAVAVANSSSTPSSSEATIAASANTAQPLAVNSSTTIAAGEQPSANRAAANLAANLAITPTAPSPSTPLHIAQAQGETSSPANPNPANADNTAASDLTTLFRTQLSNIPVFAVTDGSGSPLVTTVTREDGTVQEIGGVFMSPADAQNFVTTLQSRQPDLDGQVQVTVLTLAEIYEIDRANHIAQANPMQFAYVPDPLQIQEAQTIYQAQGEDPNQVNGVPLFFAVSSVDGGYMTIEENGASVIPIFFDKTNLDAIIDRFGANQPEIRNSVRYEVLQLERVLRTMQVMQTLEELQQHLGEGIESQAVQATLIPRLPQMLIPDVLTILSQGPESPVAAEFATRLQAQSASETAGEPIARLEAILDEELNAALAPGGQSELLANIQAELSSGIGQTLTQVAFFPADSSVQFIRGLLNSNSPTDNPANSANPATPNEAGAAGAGGAANLLPR